MRFAFGDIVVDSVQVQLSKNGKQLECEPRVFELLLYLCQHPQKAISRAELVEQVWGGRIVSDAAINRAVGELRKLVEESPSSPQWIKTVSKIGYQLSIIPSLAETPDIIGIKPANVIQASPLNVDIKLTKILNRNEDEAELSYDSLSPNIAKFQKLNVFASRPAWLIAILTLVLMIIIAFQSLVPTSPLKKQGITARHPVTSLMGSAFNPFYHIDKNLLFFLYRSDADSYAQIYMQDDSGSTQAVSNDDFYYTDVLYGHDGYLYASRLNNLQQRHCEIVKIDPETKQISSIINCGERVVTQLAYDESKRRLIYQFRASISEPYALYSYQLDTGRKQQLTHPDQKGNNLGDYAFSLSPDNTRLAVIEYRGDDIDKLKLVDLNDNHIITSSPFIDDVSGLIWRSDNHIFASNKDGLFEFNTNNLAVEVKEHSDQFGRLAHGADINSILTERSQTTINLFSFSTHSSSVAALTSNSGLNLSPALGNRSNILAFRSNRTGEEQLYIQPETSGVFNSKFNSTIEHISAMSWSPNDDKLVASINNTLYLYTLETSQWQRLAKQFTQVHHVTFAETSILFSAEVEGQWNIWQLVLDSGQIKQVTHKGGYSVQSDGKYVYYTKFNQAGLYKLNLETDVESVLIAAFPIAGWRHWQLRDNKLYYLLNKAYRALNLNSGDEHVIHKFNGRTPDSCNMAYQHELFACDQIELSNSNIWKFQL